MPVSTCPNNFLGLPPRYSDYKRARFAVLPIPYDSTTSFQVGTRGGPHAIIHASQQVELFDDELEIEAYKAGVATLDPLLPNMSGPKAMVEDLYAAARKVVRDGKFLLGLGGEHSITPGLIRAVMEKHKTLSILQIDAHLDLRDEWEGTPYSHACAMRRCLDLGTSLVSVGIRNISREEHGFLRASGAPIRTRSVNDGLEPPRSRRGFLMPPPLPRGDKGGLAQSRDGKAAKPSRAGSTHRSPTVDVVPARACHLDDTWIDRAVDALGETVYVSIDIDGFDPAYAPGTGTPEPGGLDWYQVTSLIRRTAEERNIVAADVVEVMPIPGQAVTEFLAARLAYKLVNYVNGKR
ncbi:MAG: agmatinase family protein [Planctomycetes bacterium]|nr:agmatinase family protein [Planctomycetota bacterium]